jgi:7,8-dihydropterin-6-yl-methyl-4-(beta-D-ribofuranosyl)aminobenzene 5'-phosphate synthase
VAAAALRREGDVVTAAPSSVRLTILVDNEAPPGLLSEHGFSVLVETPRQRILFDTGQGPALVENTQRLGLSLENLDTLILSHGHYDHTGGIPFVLEHSPRVRLYAHPSVVLARCSRRNDAARSLSMPESSRTAVERLPGDSRRWVTEPLELTCWAGLSGPIPRLVEYEDTGGPFTLDSEGTVPDPIEDDLALWLRTSNGLVVIVGCCHAGLVNTLLHVQKTTGESRTAAVLGGLHLLAASGVRLERSIAALRELNVSLVVPCHCTGPLAHARLQEALGARVCPGQAGAQFTFELPLDTNPIPHGNPAPSAGPRVGG